ncbi:MAG TPA: SRPBCC family protein [Pseudonocardia sp.]
MSDSDQIKVTRTVDASPEQVFAVLTDPARHAELDGSAMLRGLEGGSTLTGVGDEFIMNMNNDILGDYQMRNEVVSYEKDRKIGWAPLLYPEGAYADKLGDMKPGGHTYTWELRQGGSGGTEVTQVYDWSGVTDAQFRGLFPMLSEEQLGESIDRAGRLAT